MKLVDMYSQNPQKYYTDKGYKHQYIQRFYDSFFEPYRLKPINLLEIGIAEGYSHQLWHDYFINGMIYGVENDSLNPDSNFQKLTNKFKKTKRIKIFFGNGYSENFIKKIKHIKFDFIIDDGSHKAGDQLKCLTLYSPVIKKHGVIIIEDVQPPAVGIFKSKQKEYKQKYNKTIRFYPSLGPSGDSYIVTYSL